VVGTEPGAGGQEKTAYTSLGRSIGGSGRRSLHLRGCDRGGNGLCHSQEGQELHLTRDHGGGEEGWRFFGDDFRRAQSYGVGPGFCIILYTHERTERIVAVAISDAGGSSRPLRQRKQGADIARPSGVVGARMRC
jgi:hypothetical protein